MSSGFDRLRRALEDDFDASSGEPWSDEHFERRALEVFHAQYEGCAPLRALCDARGVTPDAVGSWRDVPLVPTAAFKQLDLVSAPAGPDARVFRTSGTTRGRSARGRHHVPRPSLYRAALRGPLRAALLPDRASIRFVSLIPAPDAVPDSSLSFMIGAAAEAFADGVDWLVDAEGRWSPRAAEVWADVVSSGEPVLLVGTALAFVHALEREGRAEPVLARLPEGSRVMETGGFKGSGREIGRTRMYAALAGRIGLPESRIVNEYGMTELCSQLWETVLCDGEERGRSHLPAPWLRVRALDPVSLEPLPEGQEGVLAFYDLANAGSVSHVLTEDIGAIVDGRVRLKGRAPGAEPRGCSRAMDEMMSAAGR